MKKAHLARTALLALAVLCVVALGGETLKAVPRKHKPKEAVAGNDPTSRLYQMLDQSEDGKLSLYLLADVYSAPSKPDEQYQRVLHAVYDKSLYFGRFTIHVRSVSKLTPQQLSTYTPEQIFHYASSDAAEFEKINPGAFGKAGDLYLAAPDNHPLTTAPITEEVQQEYDMLVTDYILPAAGKQASAKSQ